MSEKSFREIKKILAGGGPGSLGLERPNNDPDLHNNDTNPHPCIVLLTTFFPLKDSRSGAVYELHQAAGVYKVPFNQVWWGRISSCKEGKEIS